MSDEARQSFIDGLTLKMDTGRLNRFEVTIIVEGQILDTLRNETIPELRLMISDMPEGLEKENARLFITVAEEFAQGMEKDIGNLMAMQLRVVQATEKQLKALVGG